MLYPKIQTVYKRDPATKYKTLLEGDYSLPELNYLAELEWEFTEKVDGTNIRVFTGEAAIRFGGRTDNAQIPVFLYDKLNEIFSTGAWRELPPMILFGEGFGAKIQKGGGNYISDGVDFTLFDIWCDGWWLEQYNVIDIARKLGIEPIPIVGHGTLSEMVSKTREGFNSWWGRRAEGIVARPVINLLTRSGHRIITKIKYKDFLHV